jgi:hypothetical protein
MSINAKLTDASLPFDLFTFRERVASLSDTKLLEYGKAAARVVGFEKSASNLRTGESIAEAQLAECRAEWLRRYPEPLTRRDQLAWNARRAFSAFEP